MDFAFEQGKWFFFSHLVLKTRPMNNDLADNNVLASVGILYCFSVKNTNRHIFRARSACLLSKQAIFQFSKIISKKKK